MRLPKSFVPRKDLTGKVEDIITTYHSKAYERIKSNYEEFLTLAKIKRGGILSLNNSKEFENMYRFAKHFAPKISYSVDHVSKFCEEFKENQNILGLYVSGLLNSTGLKNSKFNLKQGNNFDGIGAYHKIGTITINGDLGDWTGAFMKGGEIIIYGNVGNMTGYKMNSGKITVHGKITGIDEENCQGIIYQGKDLIWRGKPEPKNTKTVL
ncbi:MAG: hypothetical protein L6408_01160 [Nanoarchaeota archaeon]|nr:hypothetical protein [Nanoarchaeota archaeon]